MGCDCFGFFLMDLGPKSPPHGIGSIQERNNKRGKYNIRMQLT